MNFIEKIKRKNEKLTETDNKLSQAKYADLRKVQARYELQALVKGTEKKLDENLLDTMIPYADLMTLLLVFFVFFFIISSNKQFTSFEEAKNADKQFEMNESTFTIPSEILFTSGKADLKKGAERELNLVVDKIMESFTLDENWEIRIEGHTDNVPISNSEYPSNWELSTARAISIMRIFINNYNFSPSQLQVMGFGENKPIVTNDTEKNREMNRRVEIKINKKYSELRK